MAKPMAKAIIKYLEKYKYRYWEINNEIAKANGDFDQIVSEEAIEFIHPIHAHPWGQRAFRIYDPDHHIVEFGEPMSVVVIRYHQEGMTKEEISKKTLMPIEIVNQIIDSIKS